MKEKLPQISRVSEFYYKNTIQIFGENFDKDTLCFLWYPQNCEIYVDCSADDLKKGIIPKHNDEYAADNAISNINIPRFDAENFALPKTPPEDAIQFSPCNILNQVLYINSSKEIKTGVAVVYLKNSVGFSKPFVANKPRIFGLSHSEISQGSVLTVWGSLMEDGRHKIALLKNKKTKESFIIANASDPNYCFIREKYVVEFIIPENIPQGDYTLKIHNGTGEVFGWSDEVEIKITAKGDFLSVMRNTWNENVDKSVSFDDVKTVILEAPKMAEFCDMTEKIQSAIDSLDSGIVILGSGTFGISKTLELKKGVVLKGAGESNTVIRPAKNKAFIGDFEDANFAARKCGAKRWALDWKPSFIEYGFKSLVRVTDECGIEDICFKMDSGVNVGILVSPKQNDTVSGAFFNSVKIDGMYHCAFSDKYRSALTSYAFLCVCNTFDLVINSCNFKAIAPIKMLPARNTRTKFINSIFECSPAQVGEAFIGGAYMGMFIGNKFLYGRRGFMSQDGFCYNLVYQNKSVGVARSVNAQENYMAEYGESVWHGYIREVSDSYLILNDDLDARCVPQTFSDRLSEYDQTVAIIDGRGFGQYRKIVDFKDNKLYIDKPFDVNPDKSSLLVISQSALNNVWLSNNTENANGPTMFSYGSSIDNIIASHYRDLASDMRIWAGGIRNTESFGQDYQIQIASFNLIDSCQSKASGKGLDIDSSYFREGKHFNLTEYPTEDKVLLSFGRTNGVFGNIVRKNVFSGDDALFYKKNQGDWLDEPNAGGISMAGGYNIIEFNRLKGYMDAVFLIDDCEGNFIGNNLYSENSNILTGHFENAIGPDAKLDIIY